MADGNRVAVLLGATSPVARELARLLLAQRVAVVLAGRDGAELRRTGGDLAIRQGNGAVVEIAIADLVDDDPGVVVREVNAAAQRAGGELEQVVLVAGMLGEQRAMEEDPAALREVIDANFRGPVGVLTLFARDLARRGHGSLAIVSSVAAVRGRASNYAYGAAKAGLDAWAQGLRHRIWRQGVSVVVIRPGVVDTAMAYGAPVPVRGASPTVVAQAILRAMERDQPVSYVPAYWRWVMLGIRHLPSGIFKHLRI